MFKEILLFAEKDASTKIGIEVARNDAESNPDKQDKLKTASYRCQVTGKVETTTLPPEWRTKK